MKESEREVDNDNIGKIISRVVRNNSVSVQPSEIIEIVGDPLQQTFIVETALDYLIE